MSMMQIMDSIEYLENLGYKVLSPLPMDLIKHPAGAKLGAVVDTETIGKAPLDPQTKLIELGIVVFAYDPVTFKVLGPVRELSQYVDPGCFIPSETTALTGITNEMVAGAKLDKSAITAVLEGVDLIVAHNVSYDRPVVEREVAMDIFRTLPWVCSIKDIDWLKRGINGTKLEYLAMVSGFHYKAHRASVDCFAVTHLLQVTDTFKELYRVKDSVSYQIWAIGDTFAMKDVLKAKDFVFDAGSPTTSKGWVKSCSELEYQLWVDWLLESIYKKSSIRLPVREVNRTQWHSLHAPVAQMVLVTKSKPPALDIDPELHDIINIFEEPPH